MINGNLELLIFAETEVSEGNEPEPTDAHGIDLQFDSLSDSEYGGADLLSGYDVELFSRDATTAEVDTGIRERHLNEEMQNEYFLRPEDAPESVADEITRELNGDTLFNDSQSQLKYSSAPKEKDNGILLIAVLGIAGVLIGISSALLWRKIRKKVKSDI